MFRSFFLFLYSFIVLRRIVPSFLRLFSWFFKSPQVIINNFKMNLSLKSSIDREIYLKNTYETDQVNYVLTLLKNKDFEYFFDIGSYIGYYSLVVNDLTKKVIAFEPNKENFERLKKNVEINNFNITCHNLACSDKKSVQKLWFTNKNKRGGSSIFDPKDNEFKKYDQSKILYENVKSVLLDELYDVKNSKIFFKIDVERHELNVLKGASNLLSNNEVIIQIEIFPHLKEKILHYLNQNNFRLMDNIDNDYYLKNF